MKTDDLTGIERDLVLQYLIDGNIPVTLTPTEDKNNKSIHSLTSQIFPIALKPDNIKVEKNGKIKLLNPSQSVRGFSGKLVKVEFYFNRVGLYFISKVEEENNELAIIVPSSISRIKDLVDETDYSFSAFLYMDCKNKKSMSLKAIPWGNEELFTRPVWKSIPLDNQKEAKSYLEKFVEDSKKEKLIGNGIQLIPICNYLTYKEEKKMEAMENRRKPLSILYVDHERIVFGSDNKDEVIEKNDEYGIKLSFSIKNSPILSRDIFVVCSINKIYTSNDNSKNCYDCIYTTIQEEDLRYIFEKATKRLFI